MRRCLIVALLILAIRGYTQEVKTTFHDDLGSEVETLDESTFYRNFYLDTVLNSVNIYRMEEFFSSTNTPKRAGYVTNQKEPFKFFFEKSEFYPTGTMKSYEKFNISGAPIDSAFYFYPNSRLKFVTYRNPDRDRSLSDKSLEYVVYFDSLQNRLLTNGTGFIHLDISSPLWEGGGYEEGNMVDSYREGVWKGKLNDYIIEEKYERGILLSGKSISPRGKETIYTSETSDVARASNNVADIRTLIPQLFEYPAEALRHRVKGTINVSFIVEENGEISNIRVLRDIGFGTKEAAKRVFQRVGNMRPATIRGVPVRMRYSVPIVLRGQ